MASHIWINTLIEYTIKSSFTQYNYNFFKFLQVHGDLLWASFLFSLKILALAGIWTGDFPRTKLICYQLGYPGLDCFGMFVCPS